MKRIPDRDLSQPKHDKAMQYVSDLVFDLKKQLLGYEPFRAITVERLDEWMKVHHADLKQCRSGGLFK